jgi:hypothetical protein
MHKRWVSLALILTYIKLLVRINSYSMMAPSAWVASDDIIVGNYIILNNINCTNTTTNITVPYLNGRVYSSAPKVLVSVVRY